MQGLASYSSVCHWVPLTEVSPCSSQAPALEWVWLFHLVHLEISHLHSCHTRSRFLLFSLSLSARQRSLPCSSKQPALEWARRYSHWSRYLKMQQHQHAIPAYSTFSNHGDSVKQGTAHKWAFTCDNSHYSISRREWAWCPPLARSSTQSCAHLRSASTSSLGNS